VARLLDEHKDQIAGMILEPVMMNAGIITPEPGYLHSLKELLHQHNALLTFDEVKTGLTVGPGGVTQAENVQPDRIDQALIDAGRDLGLGRVRTFVRVTLPLSRQPIMTGMLITALPMLGDYFTNQLLSGTAGTTMFGNVVDDQLSSSGGVLQGQGAVFSLLFLLVLIAPMIYYVVATNRSSRRTA